MKLSVVIVNYNTASLLSVCLKSVYQAIDYLKDDCQVIVVDNGSKDHSLTLLNKGFPQVDLIKNKKNEGFAKANNQGIRASQGEYILLLNSDTRVTKESFKNMLQSMEDDKQIAVLGCQLRNDDDTIQSSVGFSPSIFKVFCWMLFLDDLPFISSIVKPYHVENKSFYLTKREVDWVTGACFLFKANIVESSGLLDENIFMYAEEVEWCYRIKKQGLKIYYSPMAIVYHSKGGSGEGSHSGIVEEINSLRYFYSKHKPVYQQLLLSIIYKFGALLRFILFGIIVRHPKKAQLYAKILTLA